MVSRTVTARMVLSRTAGFSVLLLSLHLCFAASSSGGDASATVEPADSKVHQIEYAEFWRFVEKNPLVLMEFYAPWYCHAT